MTCATCKHWSPRNQAPWQSTDLRHAPLGPNWAYKSPMHTCQRHIPASDAVSAARALAGKSLPAQQKLGSDQMNQVFPEIAVTADARQWAVITMQARQCSHGTQCAHG